MLLAVDVGNTQTVLGLYKEEELQHMWRLATNKKDSSDELRIKLLSLLVAAGIDIQEVQATALASVVPLLTARWVEVAHNLFAHEAFVVNAKTAGVLFKTDYPNPDEIGADRVADAVAAVTLYGAPVVVVDFGTATNIEIIDHTGAFVGGIIAPGMETSAASLFAHASKLSSIEMEDPRTAVGKSTDEAVQAGIIYGEAEKVDGLIRRVFAQLGYETPVIATGGLAATIAKVSATITHVDPELTLDGLCLIYSELNG